MLRIHFYGVVFLSALFLASCGCGDDEEGEDDASINDTSIDVCAPDVSQNIDARRPDTKCPPDPPTRGTYCTGNVTCTYKRSENCFSDCTLFDCPRECFISRLPPPLICEDQFECEDGTWKQTGIDFGDPCPPLRCICPDAGPDGSRRDSSTDDDAGSDDDAGN